VVALCLRVATGERRVTRNRLPGWPTCNRYQSGLIHPKIDQTHRSALAGFSIDVAATAKICFFKLTKNLTKHSSHETYHRHSEAL
jgi:hypothetical protein